MEDRYTAFRHGGGLINGYNYPPGWYIEAVLIPGQRRQILAKNGPNIRPWDSKAKAEAAVRREKQHTFWRAIWTYAMSNMPYRINEIRDEKWFPIDVGTTPIPTYIKANVKGSMKMINNQVHQLSVTITENTNGRQAMLARLLGYMNVNTNNPKFRGKPHHNRVYTAMTDGSKPRDPVKADLLKRLAEPDGNELAWKLAYEKLGAKIKHYHKVQK